MSTTCANRIASYSNNAMAHESTSPAPFFSLIMPVYGVERYIADAIADVLTQTWRDFELIIVNDCTPDRSVEIAHDLADHDSRVRFVSHEVNKGLSAARNTGIAESRGTWLLFPDPDDRYSIGMLEVIHGVIERNDPDLVVFNHVQEYYAADGTHLYDNAMNLPTARYNRGVELGHAAVELEKLTHLGYAWNKAYRSDIVRNAHLAFEDDVPLIEDILFNVAYLSEANSVITMPNVLYRYAKRQKGSLTGAFVPNYFELHRRRIREIADFAAANGALDETTRPVLGALYARFILSALEQNTDERSGLDHRARIAWLHALFEDDLFCELVPGARAEDSKALTTCIALLNTHNVPALLALGRTIHLVRTKSTTLYTKAKSRR